jgi:hypothetical protein
MAGLLILSSLCGYLLIGHALKPVDRMTHATLGIGISNLSERLTVPQAKDEIEQLAIAWNQLLARLDDWVVVLTIGSDGQLVSQRLIHQQLTVKLAP